MNANASTTAPAKCVSHQYTRAYTHRGSTSNATPPRHHTPPPLTPPPLPPTWRHRCASLTVFATFSHGPRPPPSRTYSVEQPAFASRSPLGLGRALAGLRRDGPRSKHGQMTLFTRATMYPVADHSNDHSTSSFSSVSCASAAATPSLLLPLPLIHYWLPVPAAPPRTTAIGGSLGLDCRTTASLRPSSAPLASLRSLSAQGRRYRGRIRRPVPVSS